MCASSSLISSPAISPNSRSVASRAMRCAGTCIVLIDGVVTRLRPKSSKPTIEICDGTARPSSEKACHGAERHLIVRGE